MCPPFGGQFLYLNGGKICDKIVLKGKGVLYEKTV